jgi:hypothetical protein
MPSNFQSPVADSAFWFIGRPDGSRSQCSTRGYEFVLNLQQVVGAAADGKWGPETSRRLAAFMLARAGGLGNNDWNDRDPFVTVGSLRSAIGAILISGGVTLDNSFWIEIPPDTLLPLWRAEPGHPGPVNAVNCINLSGPSTTPAPGTFTPSTPTTIDPGWASPWDSSSLPGTMPTPTPATVRPLPPLGLPTAPRPPATSGVPWQAVGVGVLALGAVGFFAWSLTRKPKPSSSKRKDRP